MKITRLRSERFFNEARFESVHLVFLGLSLAYAWVLQYFPGVPSIIERISFKAEDPSWIAPGFTSIPILGVHFFGDFQYPVSMGQQLNPWIQEMPAPWLPSMQLILNILSGLDYSFAFLLYLAVSIYALLFGAWSISNVVGKIDFWDFTRKAVVFLFFASPTIVDFDRGNWHSMMIGFACVFIARTIRGQSSWNVLWILFCASLKPYYVLFLFLYVNKVFDVKKLVVALTSFVVLNAVLWQIYTGNVWLGIKEFVMDIAFFSGSDVAGTSFGLDQIMHSGSIAGAVSRIIEFFFGSAQANAVLKSGIVYFQVASVIYICFSIYFLGYSKAPLWQRLFSIFSIVSLANLGSMAYTWGWIGIVALVAIFESRDKYEGAGLNSISKNALFQIICILGLVPAIFVVTGPSGVGRYLSNFLLLTPLVIAMQIMNLSAARKSGEQNYFHSKLKRFVRHRGQ